MVLLYIFLIAITGFFFGGIPFGVIISKLWGKDPRQGGSGNIGTTNVFRTVGIVPGILTFILDIFKGLIFVLIVKILLKQIYINNNIYLFLPSFAAISVVLGHIFSPYLKFKGGKGVATGLGTIVILLPIISLICFCVFIVLLLLFRIVSLASIISAVVLVISIVIFKFNFNSINWGEFSYGIIIAIFIIIAHRKNIKRLIKGKEKKISWKK